MSLYYNKNINVLDYITSDGDFDIPLEVITSTDTFKLANAMRWAIASGKIRFPYRKYFIRNLEELMKNRAQTSIEEYPYIKDVPKWIKHCDYLYEGKELACVYQKGDYRAVNQIPDLFTEEARMSARINGYSSPIKGWVDKRNEIVDFAINRSILHSRPIDISLFSECVFSAGIKCCTHYKVGSACAFYEFFDAKIVYCPCFGWGCRAIGAIMSKCTKLCYGCDPNPALVDGYEKMTALGKEMDTDIIFKMTPMEAFPLEQYPRPELIFTSPPFGSYEIYSDHLEQSIITHPTHEEWLNDWLIPQTIRSLKHLKVGGHLIYYIANMNKIDIITPLIEALNKPGIHFCGGIPSICGYAYRHPINHFVFRKTAEIQC